MAPPLHYPHNYYHILGLASPTLHSTPTSPSPSSQALKAAYRKALLAAHPDKTPRTAAAAGNRIGNGIGDTSVTATKGHGHVEATPTIDAIRTAYAILSHAEEKAAFDGWLASTSTSTSFTTPMPSNATTTTPGLESFDLSDFTVYPSTSPSPSTYPPTSPPSGGEQWTRPCRCGAPHGFRISERDLEYAEREGEGEVLVGCEGCSLWVRVGFAVEDEEGEG